MGRFRDISIKRKVLIVLSAISFVSIVFILAKTNNQTTKKTGTETPTSKLTNVTEVNKEPKRTDVNEVYLLNRLNSLDGIIGYTWLENRIIYATKNGVFDLWQNKKIISDNIIDIEFSKNGTAIYSNSSGVYWVDIKGVDSKKTLPSNTKPKISDSGNYFIYINGSNLISEKINENSPKNINIGQGADVSVGWIDNSEYIFVYNRRVGSVEIYNAILEQAKKINIDVGQELAGISPDLGKIATKLNENLYVKNTSTNELDTYNFTALSSLQTHWIDQDQIFVTEKVNRNIFDLFDQYFWSVNTKTKYKKFLTNSVVITYKIDSNIVPEINKDKTAIIFSEVNGKIWTISLVSSKIVIYSETGISFYRMENTSKEAD